MHERFAKGNEGVAYRQGRGDGPRAATVGECVYEDPAGSSSLKARTASKTLEPSSPAEQTLQPSQRGMQALEASVALTAAASTGPVRSLIRENRPEGIIPFRSLQRTVAATGGSGATAMVNDVAMMEQRRRPRCYRTRPLYPQQ